MPCVLYLCLFSHVDETFVYFREEPDENLNENGFETLDTDPGLPAESQSTCPIWERD